MDLLDSPLNSGDSKAGQGRAYTELKWADLRFGQKWSQTKQTVIKSVRVFEGVNFGSSSGQETIQKLFSK